jgi:pSer/pThr/pTyr-binding forkhead associated (FHA) protein
MKVICGKCKARININTEDANSDIIRFKCPVCNTVNKLNIEAAKNSTKQADDKTIINTQENLEDVMGWLVVHDENTKQQTYNLKKGKNIVGRKSTSKPCDILIETADGFMSRNHFAIEISLGTKGLEYMVYDITSTNGTFINADKQLRLNQMDKVLLKDGDTIQAGHTKMVIRTKMMAGTAKNATDTVINTAHLRTVIIE